MKKFLTMAAANTLLATIDLQLKNKYLPKWAREELEKDKAEMQAILSDLRKMKRA